MTYTYHDYHTRTWQGISLSPQQAAVLFILHVRRGIVPVDDIIDFIWCDDNEPDHAISNIKIAIMLLRKKFGRNVILTRHGRGYEIGTISHSIASLI